MATVDTLKAYEALTAADMPDRQARALVTIVQELQEARLADVAGKADVSALKTELKEDIASLRSEMQALAARHEIKFTALEARIDRVKFDLLKWFIPLILGQAAFVVTLLKLLK